MYRVKKKYLDAAHKMVNCPVYRKFKTESQTINGYLTKKETNICLSQKEAQTLYLSMQTIIQVIFYK